LLKKRLHVRSIARGVAYCNGCWRMARKLTLRKASTVWKLSRLRAESRDEQV